MPNKNIIKSLENEIALYTGNINGDPSDANSYNLMGLAYFKLASETGDLELYYPKALECYNIECYNIALKLDSTNSVYFVDRAKLYLSMNDTDKASQDSISAASNIIFTRNKIMIVYVHKGLDYIKDAIPEIKDDLDEALMLKQSGHTPCPSLESGSLEIPNLGENPDPDSKA